MCGVTSRRGAETLISEKRVTVNDSTVEELGTVVLPDRDIVKVDGVAVTPVTRNSYVLLNKPIRVMTTLHDPFKRTTVANLVAGVSERVYPVGRLDYDTSGVLLLTNDGELAYRLTHPKYGVKKVYEATVLGKFTLVQVREITSGVRLSDGAMGRAEVRILGHLKNQSRIQLTLTEGRKREVRQLCLAVGFPVRKLRRVLFGGISSHGMKTGDWRFLTSREVADLKRQVDL